MHCTRFTLRVPHDSKKHTSDISCAACKSVLLCAARKLIAIEESRHISRLTVVSREAKKKQHACASSGPRDHYSELFTRMAALKF